RWYTLTRTRNIAATTYTPPYAAWVRLADRAEDSACDRRQASICRCTSTCSRRNGRPSNRARVLAVVPPRAGRPAPRRKRCPLLSAGDGVAARHLRRVAPVDPARRAVPGDQRICGVLTQARPASFAGFRSLTRSLNLASLAV